MRNRDETPPCNGADPAGCSDDQDLEREDDGRWLGYDCAEAEALDPFDRALGLVDEPGE